MSKTIPIFLFTWICLSLVGYFLYIGTVESDLHARSKKAASSAGHEWLSISLQGRDITLHGNAPDEDALNNVVRVIKNVYGVRIVEYDHTLNELPAQALLEIKISDRDNIGVIDTLDVFPDNANKKRDYDADGLGDNADADDVNDNVKDSNNHFPLDPQEQNDNDLDGIGNNSDTDDDNDGIKDHLDAFPYLHADISDMDGDGVSDSQDIYPNDISRWSDEQIETSSIDKNQNSFYPCSIDIASITSQTMIYFETSSSIVDSEGIELLDNLAALLTDCPFYQVNITGHTDIRGSQFLNQKLSAQRAAAVEEVLVDLGVNLQRIDTSGAAAAFPVEDNTTINGLAGNRRVEVAITQ